MLKTVPAVNKARQNAREITAKDILMIHFDFLTSPRPVEDLSCTNSLRDLLWVSNQKYLVLKVLFKVDLVCGIAKSVSVTTERYS